MVKSFSCKNSTWQARFKIYPEATAIPDAEVWIIKTGSCNCTASSGVDIEEWNLWYRSTEHRMDVPVRQLIIYHLSDFLIYSRYNEGSGSAAPQARFSTL